MIRMPAVFAISLFRKKPHMGDRVWRTVKPRPETICHTPHAGTYCRRGSPWPVKIHGRWSESKIALHESVHPVGNPGGVHRVKGRDVGLDVHHGTSVDGGQALALH